MFVLARPGLGLVFVLVVAPILVLFPLFPPRLCRRLRAPAINGPSKDGIRENTDNNLTDGVTNNGIFKGATLLVLDKTGIKTTN